MVVDDHHSSVIETPIDPFVPDEAEVAAVAFLARYSGRTPVGERFCAPSSVVFEGHLGPSWLLDRAVKRSHRGWALGSGAETGAGEVTG